MLKLIIPASEDWDPVAGEFITHKEVTLSLEHSLVSLSKWEMVHEKPFLEEVAKGVQLEELRDYVRCMTISQNVDPSVYQRLTAKDLQRITKYIEAPMTATTFSDMRPGGSKKEIMTAELFYYYMTALNIPFECQKWHLNRLLTLIRVCAIKNAPDEKMSAAENRKWRSQLNAARRGKHKTKG